MPPLRAFQRVALLAALLASPAVARAQPALAVDDLSLQEGAGGSNIATFTLRLIDTTRTLFLTVSTAVPTGVPAATPASNGVGCGGHVDYLPLTAVGVTLSPTARQRDVIVTLCGDTFDEEDERFLLRIFQTNGSSVSDNEAIATIADDDPTPSLRINDVTVTEGGAGTTRVATFNISLSASSGRPVSFNVATAPSPSGVAASGGACGTAGVDFTTVPSTPITIPAFSPATSQSVTVCGDGVYEGAEHLAVTVTGATNAGIQDGTGILTISDDEAVPRLAVTAAIISSTLQPSAVYSEARFTVTMTAPPIERAVSFAYATENGTATGSNSCLDVTLGGVVRRAGDYITKSGTQSFAPGAATSMVIPVSVCKLKIRSGETFTFRISASGSVQVTTASATVTAP